MAEKLEIIILEPYYGGSHAAFVDVLKRHSRHRITLATLPARKWKWRMRGAAIWFARHAHQWLADGGGAPGLILCNDMLSVTDLIALLPRTLRSVPIVCYFHENQLTYPLPEESDRDYQYGMTNITSCLAADAIWFNSTFHREDFLKAAGVLLRKMPDHVPDGILQDVRAKSTVVPPPVAAVRVARAPRSREEPVTLLWSHRWEYDKNPEPFFDALIRLDQAGRPFKLVLLGEQFRTAPVAFGRACDSLKPHIVHAGFVPDRADYVSLLSKCDLVVSTAIQENFGIAVIEAILAGCQPLLPNRLAYPEIIPDELHGKCLYPTDEGLFERLSSLLAQQGWLEPGELSDLQNELERRFGAESAVKRLDDGLEEVAQAGRHA